MSQQQYRDLGIHKLKQRHQVKLDPNMSVSQSEALFQQDNMSKDHEQSFDQSHFASSPKQFSRFHQYKNLEDQSIDKSQTKKRVAPLKQSNLMLDDEFDNANIDLSQEKFTDEQIKEAYDILDLNKDGALTAEDLQLYLEMIGEKATEEEIDFMIRMCDSDGNGDVKFDEFLKMVTGSNLLPLAQHHQQQVQKSQLNATQDKSQIIEQKQTKNIGDESPLRPVKTNKKEKEILNINKQLQESIEIKQSNNPFIINLIQASPDISPHHKQQLDIQPISFVQESLIQESFINKSQYNGQIMKLRQQHIKTFINEAEIDFQKLEYLIERQKTFPQNILQYCNYSDFIQFIESQRIKCLKYVFNILTEHPVNEDQVQNTEFTALSTININYFLLHIIGKLSLGGIEKLELSYNTIDYNSNGYISFNELIDLLQHLHFLVDTSKFNKKIQNLFLKKKISINDKITQDTYNQLINEFSTVFLIP